MAGIRGEKEMIGGNKGLENFLSKWNIGKWQTSTRKMINVFMLIGLFIGIVGAVSMVLFYYIFLGTAGIALGSVLGLAYVFLNLFGLFNPSLFALLLGVVIYGGSWLYFIVILNRYEDLARKTVGYIETKDSLTTNDILEKGVLLGMILQESNRALETLRSALSLEGGDGLRWYIGGVTLGRMKAYREALQAFDRAIESSSDKRLLKQIKENRRLAEKRLQ